MPYTFNEAVWILKAATETKELASEFERCQVTVIEITTAAFSGTIDIQGKVHELNAYSNVPYIRQDQASIQIPSVAQIVPAIDTGVYRYVVLGYWRRLQIVMTRTAGTITCGVAGSSDAEVYPYLPASESATVETPFTGTGNIAVGVERIAPAAAFKLTEIELHLASAPTGANPNLVITLDDGVSSVYDLVILTLDLVANAVTDLVIKPNKVCKATDVITAAWTNTNGIVYGIKFKHQLL